MKTHHAVLYLALSVLIGIFLVSAQESPKPAPVLDGASTIDPQPKVRAAKSGTGSLARPTEKPQAQAHGYATAIWDEELGGDLGASLQSYLKLVSDFDQTRAPAAQSIYELAEAQLKLGRIDEARIQYARLLREFTDFPNLTQLAATRLAALPAQGIAAATTPPAFSVSPRQIAGNPTLRQLIEEEEKLVEQQIATSEERVLAGTAIASELVPLKRDLLRLKEQLAIASAPEHTTPPAVSATPAAGQNQMADPEGTIHFLEGECARRALEAQQTSGILDLIKKTEHPETISSDIIKDPRFIVLKADYDSALTGASSNQGRSLIGKTEARERLVEWLKEVYLPELETSVAFSQQQLSTVRDELGKLREERRFSAFSNRVNSF